MLLAACSTPRGTLLVQNGTGDPELGELVSIALSEQLKVNGLDEAAFKFETRLEALPDGGLQVQVLCSNKSDKLIKAHVQVKANGGSARKMIASMMVRATRELAVDCR